MRKCLRCHAQSDHFVRTKWGYFCSNFCASATGMQMEPQSLWEGVPGTCPKTQAQVDYEGIPDPDADAKPPLD